MSIVINTQINMSVKKEKGPDEHLLETFDPNRLEVLLFLEEDSLLNMDHILLEL